MKMTHHELAKAYYLKHNGEMITSDIVARIKRLYAKNGDYFFSSTLTWWR